MCVASARARVVSCYQVGRDNVVTRGGLLEISLLWDFLVIAHHCIVFFDCFFSLLYCTDGFKRHPSEVYVLFLFKSLLSIYLMPSTFRFRFCLAVTMII